jgi:alanine dehydrogenase
VLLPACSATLILGREDVATLLDIRDCIDAVERAFLRHAHGLTIPPSMVGAHVEGGGFHVKAAGMASVESERAVFAAKINANFPDNPTRHALPTIQGVVALFDATDGRLLALLDSIEITSLRTAAATAVAARYLAPELVTSVAICGCGEQARNQIRALAAVRTLSRIIAIDSSRERAERLADDLASELGVDVAVAPSPDVAHDVNIWVTCTPAHRWFLGRARVAPGAFVAAVGADNPHKQEIEPELLANNVVIADVLDQCATIGDLHHALDAQLMRREDVRAELAQVVAGSTPGRLSPEEIIVFDSTGTALQDVAVAALAYERALERGVGIAIDLGRSVASMANPVDRAGARART